MGWSGPRPVGEPSPPFKKGRGGKATGSTSKKSILKPAAKPKSPLQPTGPHSTFKLTKKGYVDKRTLPKVPEDEMRLKHYKEWYDADKQLKSLESSMSSIEAEIKAAPKGTTDNLHRILRGMKKEYGYVSMAREKSKSKYIKLIDKAVNRKSKTVGKKKTSLKTKAPSKKLVATKSLATVDKNKDYYWDILPKQFQAKVMKTAKEQIHKTAEAKRKKGYKISKAVEAKIVKMWAEYNDEWLSPDMWLKRAKTTNVSEFEHFVGF